MDYSESTNTICRFIRKQYEKRRDRKIKENEKRDAKCEDYGILIRHEISSRIK